MQKNIVSQSKMARMHMTGSEIVCLGENIWTEDGQNKKRRARSNQKTELRTSYDGYHGRLFALSGIVVKVNKA